MQLAINTVGEELRSSSEYCKNEGIGIELTDLAYPWNLDGDPKYFIEKHIKSIEGITPRVCHGPYFELNVVSFDKAIINVCRQRHRQALDIAKRIGVGIYVTHTNFNPLICQPSYRPSLPIDFLISGFLLPMTPQRVILSLFLKIIGKVIRKYRQG
jgi:endonuclease IV